MSPFILQVHPARDHKSEFFFLGGFVTQVFTPGQEWARHHDIRLNKGRLCRSSFTPFSSLSHTIFVQRTGEGFCSKSCYVSSVPRHSPSTRYTVLPGSVMQYQYILPPTFRVPTVPSSSSFQKNERKTSCFLVNCEIPLVTPAQVVY